MIEYIVFPSSYFNFRNVDEDLQNEYDAVIETGLFKTTLFDYDKWFNSGKLVLTEKPENKVSAIYRGWIMKPEQYAAFYNGLLSYNIRLITNPAEYELFHIFPNIYLRIREHTAKMIVYPDEKPVDLDEVKRTFKRFMVKDFVKSVKGTDFPKYFTSDIENDEFDKHMETFYKFRGELYTGGICIKEYLDLKTYDGKTNEYRLFIADNQIISMCRNSLQPQYTPEPPADFINRFVDLGSRLYTVDCAELADGTWRIIEAGDGQVSGLSDRQDIASFFRSLYHCFE